MKDDSIACTDLRLNFDVMRLKNEGRWPAILDESAGIWDTPAGPLYGWANCLRASRPWNVFLACVPLVKFGFIPGEMARVFPGAVLKKCTTS